MKNILLFLIFISILLVQEFAFSQECKKCDTNALLELSKNLDSLKYEYVLNFVCTFDSSCQNNVEFSEWSNRLLFKLVEKDIDLLNEALHRMGYQYVILIANELENPVVEIDPIKIYEIIRKSNGPKDMIFLEKKAIIKAAEKQGIKIKE